MTDEDRRSEGRRREDQEMAVWRGGIEARVAALEREIAAVLALTGEIKTAQSKMQGDVRLIRRDISELSDDVGKAASQIDEAQADAVQKLTASITSRDAEQSTRRGLRFQVFVGGAFTLVATAVPTLITLAITGQLG